MGESPQVGDGVGTDTDETRSAAGGQANGGDTARVASALGSDVLLEYVLNSFDAPAVLVDGNEEIIEINDEALELFETTSEGALGSEPGSLFDGTTTSLITRARDAGEELRDEEETVEASGRSIVASRTAVPFFDDGAFAGGVEIVRDITEEVHEREQKLALEQYQNEVTSDFQATLARLAEGDLTVEPTVEPPTESFAEIDTVYGEYEQMAADLEVAIDNIRGVVRTTAGLSDRLVDASDELRTKSEEVAASTGDVGQSTERLVDGTDDLTQKTQVATESVSDLSASIEEITATMGKIDATSENAADLARDGREDGQAAVSQIRTAVESTDRITNEVEELEDRMQRVNEIVDVIADIAKQTNLLALNASIEAANAGEAGNGFAVVANEVKSLAEESQESADEIERIIDDVQERTAGVVGSIDEINDDVADGADAIETVVEALEEIDTAIDETSTSTAEVSRTVDSQAENVQEVSRVVDESSSLSEEFSATIQQIATDVEDQSVAIAHVDDLAESLDRLVNDVHDTVDQFTIDDETTQIVKR